MDEHDILTRYLDALADGFDPDPSDLDPELVATVRHLRDLGNRVHPDSSFVDTLEETLMNASPLGATALAGAWPALPSASRPVSVPIAVPAPGRGPVRRWASAMLAAALLILLGGVLLTERLTDPGGDGQRPGGASILAPGTPSPEAESADELLVEVSVPAELVPAGIQASVYLTRDVIPASSTTVRDPESGACCMGLKVYLILGGMVTVTADGPAQVIAGNGSGQAEDIEPGTEVQLIAGDAIIVGTQDGNSWTTGDAPVEVLTGAVFTGYSPGAINPDGWEYGQFQLEDNTLELPGGPYTLRLMAVELEPGEKRAMPENGVVQLGIAEEGGVGRGSDGELSVPGATSPLEIYVLVLETASPDAASPAAG